MAFKPGEIGIKMPIFLTLLIALWSGLAVCQTGISLVGVPTSIPPITEVPPVEEALKRPEQVTVIAPRTLRPNSTYHVLLSLSNSTVPATFDLQLIGGRDSNHEQEEAKSVLVDSGETQIVKFNIGSWPSAEYVLLANVLAVDKSWNFTKEESLYFSAKTFSILIQTDKAIYKPGQLVQFRALFVNPELRPLSLKEQIHVRIYDSKRNVIKQWTDQSSSRGLLSLELPLSEDPVLGDWIIKVTAKDQEVTKTFTVAEYILPAFDVQVNLPSYATNNHSKVLASVRATYTYGKPVKGQVLLTVQPLIRFRQIDARPMNQAQMKAPLVDGVAEFTVDLIKDLKLEREYYEREFEFFALVEEDLTGRKYNKSNQISMYETDVKIEMVENDLPYKPGLNYTTTLKVAYRDDTPVEDNGPELELEYLSDNKKIHSVKLKPVGGLVEHTWLVPRTNTDTASAYGIGNLELQTNYRGYKFNEYLRQFLSSSNQFMKISMEAATDIEEDYDEYTTRFRRATKRKLSRLRRRKPINRLEKTFAIGDRVITRLDATEPMQKVTCYGMAGKDIIWAFNQKNTLNKTSVEFDFVISNKMAPASSLTCFYIRNQNKEMIADSMNFLVSGAMKNPVKVVVSDSEVKPGQSVEIEVFTKPHSTVGLLAVDQSVLLLKTGNDITEKDVENEMKSYGTGFEAGYSFRSTIASLFDNADVVVMSNNYMYNDYYYRPVNALPLSGVSVFRSSVISMPEMPGVMAMQPLALEQTSMGEFYAPPKPIVRSFFPETWIWANGSSNSDGRFRLSSQVPDTITSWVLSAFSLSNVHGLGVSSQKTSLKVFRPFFIKLNLPYSIIRGETVSIQANIFNYSKKPVNATVTLENKQGDFQFVEAANSIDDEKYSSVDEESHQVTIPAQDGASVSFLVTPLKLGQIDLRVRAQSQFAADAVIKKLLVKAEGQTQYLNRAVLVNLPSGVSGSEKRRFSRNVTLEFPSNYVNGSEKVFVSAIGDVLGAGLTNADDLLRMPYGCGEQNMVNLVPNIVMLNYLEKSGRSNGNQKKKALNNIEKGYQRQLNYKRHDGSFSAFGESDPSGSVWLTAYVLKSFQQAKGLTQVDNRVLLRAARYIAKYSQEDGSIKESGMLHNKLLSSKALDGSSTYLTAYCMIALLQGPISGDGDDNDDETLLVRSETDPKPVTPKQVIQRGLKNLEDRLAANTDNPYEIAIIAYALHLAGDRRESMDKAYDELWKHSNEFGDLIWWEAASHASDPMAAESAALIASTTSSTIPPLKPLARNQKQSAHMFMPDSLSIEMTALALLTIVKRGEVERATPVVKWLVSQQNSNGGFASTQDTVLAIEALSAFAAASSTTTGPPNMSIELVNPVRVVRGIPRRNNELFHIDPKNALVLQQVKLSDDARSVQIEAEGSGMSVVQVSWQYNLMVSAEKPAFYLNPILDRRSTFDYLQLSICTYYTAGDATNMAVMEVELPSGYEADVDSLLSLKRISEVRRTECVDHNSKVVIYFNRLTRDEVCLTVTAHRTSKVSNNKPAPVSIYDYYDRKKAARIFYNPKAASSCDICESDTCKTQCKEHRKPK